MSPAPLEIVLSRMAPEELCEALALLRWCARLGTVDAEKADRLSRRILARPSFRSGGETVEAQLPPFSVSFRCMLAVIDLTECEAEQRPGRGDRRA